MSFELPISSDSAGDLPPNEGGGTARLGERLSGPGGRFGNYELLEEIARGGMGVVRKARQVNPSRIVALKTISADHLGSREAVSRFRVEAEAAASLHHANIVPIYEVGEREGQPYFTMRYIEGGCLAHWMAESRARDGGWLNEAATLMIKVAGAVQFVHEHGILHRDLKPSNILLDSSREPFITDFGLAKLQTQTDGMTLTGAVIGTPEYMAPEQCQGQEVTVASDVFSLGVILYQLLAGELPFRGHAPLETMQLVVGTEPRRPGLLNPAVDPYLEAITLKCLEKDPSRRYESARALAADLARWQNHETVLARPASPPARAWKWVRRNQVWAAMLGVVAASLAGFTLMAVLNSRRFQRERDQAELHQAEALLREGQALAASGRPAEAKDRMESARQLFLAKQANPLAAELSLAEVYRFSPPPVMTLKGHRGGVACAAISPDQSRVWSGGEDGAIIAWAFPTGRRETGWAAHPGGVTALAVAPDGSCCVSGGADKKVCVWDTQGRLVRTLEGHQALVSSLSFAPEGDRLASASWDRTIRLWRWPSGEASLVIQTDFDRMRRIVFSPDGREILAGSGKGGFGVWRLNDLAQPLKNAAYYSGVSATFMAHASQILYGTEAGLLNVMDLVNDAVNNQTQLGSAITGVAFDPLPRSAIAGLVDGSVAVVDFTVSSPTPRLRFSGHASAVTALAAFPGGRLIASASQDGTVRVWDDLPREYPLDFTNHEFPTRDQRNIPPEEFGRLPAGYSLNAYTLSTAVFSPDSRLILSAGESGTIRLWDLFTGQLLGDFAGHQGAVLDVAFSPDGRRAVSSGQDGTLRVWDIASGKELKQWRVEQATICRTRFSADGRLVIGAEGPKDYPAAAADGAHRFEVQVWEADTGRKVCAAEAHRGGVFALALSPDGQRLVTGGGDGLVKLWDAATWQVVRGFQAEPSLVNDLAFTPDGQECVSVGGLRMVKLWDLRHGLELKTFPLKERATCLAVGGNNPWLLIGMENGSQKLWDLKAERELYQFPQVEPGQCSAVAMAPDGGRFLSVNSLKKFFLWDLNRWADWNRLEQAAAGAQAALQTNAQLGAALQALGNWHQFLGLWETAGGLYEQARGAGADIPSLALARCHWQRQCFERALAELGRAASRQEAPEYYLQLCAQAINRQWAAQSAPKNTNRPAPAFPAPDAGAIVRQPNPGEGKDIWTTSHLSYAPGSEAPGGGMADEALRVGGWGDQYCSLLEFKLAGMPAQADSAVLYLYCARTVGGGARMCLDRITQPWDWKNSGTGRDRERLWWADRPPAAPWKDQVLPAPGAGQWYAIEITDLYNAWQNGVCPNHGVQLRPEKQPNERFNYFFSSRYPNVPPLRPKLVVIPQKDQSKDLSKVEK